MTEEKITTDKSIHIEILDSGYIVRFSEDYSGHDWRNIQRERVVLREKEEVLKFVAECLNK